MSKNDLQGMQLEPISMKKAKELVENSGMLKSVYIDFQQLKDWLEKFDEAKYPNLGFRCYFAKYSNNEFGSGKANYNNQPTLVLRAMYNNDAKDHLGKAAKKIPHPHSSISVVANLGGLCPPDCGDSAEID